MPATVDVPHFEAAPSANVNTDVWLLQMMHPQLRNVSQELQTLSQEHGTASESVDSAHRGDLSVIQARNLATSFLVDTILEQWETVIQPLDAQVADVEDAEMSASSQDGQ